MSTAWWHTVDGPRLAQGDLLLDCRFPYFESIPDEGQIAEPPVATSDLIVVSQTCDLEHAKLKFGALCPVRSLASFRQSNPGKGKASELDNLRKGKHPSLHMLAGFEDPTDNSQVLIVEFSHIISLPVEYLSSHAEGLGPRWRLVSPYLEHFAQAFARFFMRVGLPSDIPPFK